MKNGRRIAMGGTLIVSAIAAGFLWVTVAAENASAGPCICDGGYSTGVLGVSSSGCAQVRASCMTGLTRAAESTCSYTDGVCNMNSWYVGSCTQNSGGSWEQACAATWDCRTCL
ncbi:MAG: hypothetical protein MJE77_11580 [Proteobacteria bacterium]|nr:hypothetical protein [Pseudomonadota bacterium]